MRNIVNLNMILGEHKGGVMIKIDLSTALFHSTYNSHEFVNKVCQCGAHFTLINKNGVPITRLSHVVNQMTNYEIPTMEQESTPLELAFEKDGIKVYKSKSVLKVLTDDSLITLHRYVFPKELPYNSEGDVTMRVGITTNEDYIPNEQDLINIYLRILEGVDVAKEVK